ncbi:MAG: PGPGW domain-containing protein, partial [Acidobacteria bacterium]|nr:PGPGW domain-containing protein [Acidobacteriota bacterium]
MLIKTLQQAKRVIKIVVGFTILLAGVVMLVTPGPGWVAIFGGLAILAAEFVWARRLLDHLKHHGGKLREENGEADDNLDDALGLLQSFDEHAS